MDSKRKSFVLGALAINIKNIAYGIIGLLLTPFLLKYFDLGSYGVWILIGNFLNYINLFDLGVTGTSNVLIARAKSNEKEFTKLVSNIFALQVLIASSILIVGILLTNGFVSFFELNDSTDTKKVFLLTVISYSFSFPLRVFSSTLIGFQLIHHNAIIDLVGFVLTFLFQIILVKSGLGLVSLPVGVIASKIIVFPVYYLYIKSKIPIFYFSFNQISLNEIKKLISISNYWFIGSISALLIYSSDNIIIGKFMGAEYIAAYSITLRLFDFLKERLYSINSAALPLIADLYYKGDLEKIANNFISAQRLVFVSALFVFQFMIYFNSYFVTFWVDKKHYLGDSINFFFSFNLFLTLIFHSSSIIISSTLKVKNTSILRLVEAILNITLSIILVRLLGYIGLIISTCISLLISNFWYAPYKALKILNVPIHYYIKKVIFPLKWLLILITLTNIIYFYFDFSFLRLNFLISSIIIFIWHFGYYKRDYIIDGLKIIKL